MTQTMGEGTVHSMLFFAILFCFVLIPFRFLFLPPVVNHMTEPRDGNNSSETAFASS